LKNDSLRKRFDAIKYDVKRCEEIVYDLSIRGLSPQGKNITVTGINPLTSNLDDNVKQGSDDMQDQ